MLCADESSIALRFAHGLPFELLSLASAPLLPPARLEPLREEDKEGELEARCLASAAAALCCWRWPSETLVVMCGVVTGTLTTEEAVVTGVAVEAAAFPTPQASWLYDLTIILALFIAAGEDVLLTGGVDIPRATMMAGFGFGFTSEEEVKLLARSSSSEEELSLLDSRDMLLPAGVW